MWLLMTECLPPTGSGEILNDTLEGLPTVGSDPTTDMGSGAGPFLDVTAGEVSEWEISLDKSVVSLGAYFKLDCDLAWHHGEPLPRPPASSWYRSREGPELHRCLWECPRTGGGMHGNHPACPTMKVQSITSLVSSCKKEDKYLQVHPGYCLVISFCTCQV